MSRYKFTYPFSAIVGQEEVKKALLIAFINPNTSGVLLSGEKGTAKSTIVRGLAELFSDLPFIELPLNVTEDRLVGTIDMEQAVSQGVLSLEKGLLEISHGGVVYVDEVNLLSEHIANILLQSQANRELHIEREGFSCCKKAEFSLIGSMNPEEGNLRTQFLDRFGLYVRVKGERDVQTRCEITKRRLEYESDPKAFCEKWQEETGRLKKQVESARNLVKKVKIDDATIKFATHLSLEGHCSGHRAELYLCEVAKALAAIDKRLTVSENDIKEAAKYVLPHRLKEAVAVEELLENDVSESLNTQSQDMEPNPIQQSQADPTQVFPEMENLIPSRDDWQDIEQGYEGLKLTQVCLRGKDHKGSGKRLRVKSYAKRGRYVRSRLPSGKVYDLAFDATLCQAALHPCELKGMKVQVRSEDVREKVREERTGATILFLVDASGSMGAKRRMGAVKGAVLSMLTDAYQKRDSVGIVAFRDDTADCLLNFTRSVDLAQKALRDIKTGGKTPLGAGLLKALDMLKIDRIKNPDSLQYLIVVSDGKANVSFSEVSAFEDALQIAARVATEHINSLVLDTESGLMHFGFSKKLSQALQGDYLKLKEVSQTAIHDSLKHFLMR